ncbi:MAG TPA: hypothetical protein VNW94_26160 [Streptosporangiaceae bacterium]|nr:hypothetical protein [Streptosporangiaceae bacterium]
MNQYRVTSRTWTAVALVAVLATGCGAKAGRSSAFAPSTPPGSQGSQGSQVPMLPGHYEPLWPFADSAQVTAWQQAYRTGGHSPWHLSTDVTALSFAQGYLGFADITEVTGRNVTASDARISVGGKAGTAAVIHLVRTGSGPDAPWEVVGTDDTDLSITAPAYGSAAVSPVTAGGLITGAGESLRISVRALGAAAPLGGFCCLAAGGRKTPWSKVVSFQAGAGRVLTIVVSTGGHIAAVEHFAVTGVRS